MKLYYDNLISYMPEAVIVDDKAIPDSKLKAARTAMMMLAEFQNSHNVAALYESVHQICVYAGVDIVDLIMSLKDVNVEMGSAEDLLDIAAKNLFKTVSEPKEFDYKYFAAILLSVAHAVSEAQKQQILEEIRKNSVENNTNLPTEPAS